MSLERFTRKQMVTIGPDASAQKAAELMRERHVGAIVVVEGKRPIGMITDRDLAVRIVAGNRSADTPVGEIMSGKLALARDTDLVDQAILTMRREGVRRLPIVGNDGALVGLVALDDLMVLLSAELSSTAEAILDNRGP